MVFEFLAGEVYGLCRQRVTTAFEHLQTALSATALSAAG